MTPPPADIDSPRRDLLPPGLRDLLPPDAAHEAETVEALVQCCTGHGYERVKPPLIEFEESLFSGPGSAMNDSTFRLMDPVSRRMMGMRADMTVQVARIATTRLAHVPRPLRLCYAGEVLRVTPDVMTAERELVQVGAELVGPDTGTADVEVILLAVEGLRSIGVRRISVDITAPELAPGLMEEIGIDPASRRALRAALDRKDAVAVARHAGDAASVFTQLTGAADACEPGLARLAAIDLPDALAPLVTRLRDVATQVLAEEPGVTVTIDPVENRGFEYYSGIGFSLFAPGARSELGRGGRYRVDGGERSCGFTLYMEAVLRTIAGPTRPDRLYVPQSATRSEARQARADGWITCAELLPAGDTAARAAALGCTHVLQAGRPVAVANLARPVGNTK